MGKGLPKKYAKMGFKKGWREYKKTAGWRRAHGLKGGTKAKSSPTKKSQKSSTRRSNPGGAKMSASKYVQEKWGTLWRKLRTMLNVAAPGLRAWSPPLRSMPFEWKCAHVLRNYSGFQVATPGVHQEWNIDHAAPSWWGIAVSAINDWWDRKTRRSGKISRGKIVHVGAELVPALQAHGAASGSAEYIWDFANAYNKHTDGYSMYTHTFDLSRVNLYTGARVAAWVYDTAVPSSFKRTLNNAFPKGVNPF